MKLLFDVNPEKMIAVSQFQIMLCRLNDKKNRTMFRSRKKTRVYRGLLSKPSFSGMIFGILRLSRNLTSVTYKA